MFAIWVQFKPLSIDCSHLMIVPLWPVNDKIPLFCPEQIAVEVDKTPPTLCATISINAGVE